MTANEQVLATHIRRLNQAIVEIMDDVSIKKTVRRLPREQNPIWLLGHSDDVLALVGAPPFPWHKSLAGFAGYAEHQKLSQAT